MSDWKVVISDNDRGVSVTGEAASRKSAFRRAEQTLAAARHLEKRCAEVDGEEPTFEYLVRNIERYGSSRAFIEHCMRTDKTSRDSAEPDENPVSDEDAARD